MKIEVTTSKPGVRPEVYDLEDTATPKDIVDILEHDYAHDGYEVKGIDLARTAEGDIMIELIWQSGNGLEYAVGCEWPCKENR